MHWKHSKYQILHRIVANCHTYDEAYRVLRELEEDYDLSIKLALAEHKRTNAKEIAANTVKSDPHDTDYNKLNADADLMTVSARITSVQSCMDVAADTLKFIRQCIELINPLRQFAHLSDPEAHQRCQYLEWKLDLVWKSYNMICSSGAMSYDHYISLKMHPEADKLLTVVEEFLNQVRSGHHQDLLRLTKADVFSKVVNSNETYMASVSQTFAGIKNDSIFSGIENKNN